MTERIEDWKAVGAVLEFDQYELDVIDQEYENVQHKKTNFLVQWIVRNHGKAILSLNKLAEQVFTGERLGLLKDLCHIITVT